MHLATSTASMRSSKSYVQKTSTSAEVFLCVRSLSPAISDIAHAGDVITAALAIPPSHRGCLGGGTAWSCLRDALLCPSSSSSSSSERASERSRVGKSVRRGDEKEGRKREAGAGRKKQRAGRVERLNGIKMTLPWRIASPPSDRFTNFSGTHKRTYRIRSKVHSELVLHIIVSTAYTSTIFKKNKN